ncbi:TonB-dependent receptor [Paludisphaera sp.]|uniref:TonB-dependent receptor n=1 Tax=Paludisphaera sp. TaxID=2017432 RepID=UPI00301C1947
MEPRSDRECPTTREKALRINLDRRRYGNFAEIGAGQEVVRWFFQVGGAAGTIAKSISAYDMRVSDDMYGPAARYVSRDRLESMLDREHDMLLARLGPGRGAETDFFTFADTVAARNHLGTNECHGWMGIQFQSTPGSAPSRIVVHVRMLDRDNVSQQQALGVVGVNLIHGALYQFGDPDELMRSLLDDLTPDRIEIDMIRFSGPEFRSLDHRLLSLKLVQLGLSDAAMFSAAGEVLQPSEALHKKPILVERGSFRPVTLTNLDMLRAARRQFAGHVAAGGPGSGESEIVTLMELTMRDLRSTSPVGGEIDYDDFLARADVLATTGATVLISNYYEFHRLASYLRRYTKRPIGVPLGVPTLIELFDERAYEDLEGGLLEALGRLFRNDLKLYVHPLFDAAAARIVTADDLELPLQHQALYEHLRRNGYVEGIEGYDPEHLRYFPQDVLRKLAERDPTWEAMVPPAVAAHIKEHALFGYRRPDAAGGPGA